jgi:hypothetical protein
MAKNSVYNLSFWHHSKLLLADACYGAPSCIIEHDGQLGVGRYEGRDDVLCRTIVADKI